MTDRASSGPASFSGYDRRRPALTLKRTSDVHWFQRVQAVLRVAEGDPSRSVARSLRISRRSVQRWVEIYRRRRHPEDLREAPPARDARARPPISMRSC
jgi:Helix-turn-helix domain